MMNRNHMTEKTSLIMEKRLRRVEEANIDVLPDEILTNIIGRLDGAKQAARTSAVCQRWRNLWAFLPDLSFGKDVDNHLLVTRALKAYKGSTAKSLRIAVERRQEQELTYVWLIECMTSMTKWGTFAINKRVQTLELDLSHLTRPRRLELRSHPVLARLKSLSVSFMSMTDEVFEHIVSVNMETLSLRDIKGLKGVRVRAPKLKQLMLLDCATIETIDIISAPNLQYFKHCDTNSAPVRTSHEENMSINNVPKLSSLYLGGPLSANNKSLFELNNTGVENLVLDMAYMRRDAHHFPWLVKMKQLELRFVDGHLRGAYCMQNLIFLIIKACPNLEKLTLNYEMLRGLDHDNVVEFESTFKHPFLEAVEFIGWCGLESELQLASHLIGTCTNLRELTFDSNPRNDEDRPWCHMYPMDELEQPDVKAYGLSIT